MVSRCPICNGRVLRHSVKLECDNCSKFIHIQCLPLDKVEYDVITKWNHGWTCPHCCGIFYAFNGIDDDHCFASAFQPLWRWWVLSSIYPIIGASNRRFLLPREDYLVHLNWIVTKTHHCQTLILILTCTICFTIHRFGTMMSLILNWWWYIQI